MSVGALGANLLLRLIQLYGIIGLPLIYRLGNSQRELHLGVLQRKKIYKGPDYPEVKGKSHKDTFGFFCRFACIHEVLNPEADK